MRILLKPDGRHTASLLLSLMMLLLVMLGGALPALGASVITADECGYPACHGGAPVPGTEASVTPSPAAPPTPLVLARPAVSARPRARRLMTVSGSLAAAHYGASTVKLELARKSRGRWVAKRTVTVPVTPGSASYSARLRLPMRGTWRVRATHADEVHPASASSYRTFAVR
jgi:hypothetical protein